MVSGDIGRSRLQDIASSKNFLGGRKRQRTRSATEVASRQISVPVHQSIYDAVDQRIVLVLQQDGRMSNTAIARSLKLAEATVRRRVNRLLREGMLRIVAVPSPNAAGLTLSSFIGLSCELHRLDEIAETLATFPEIRYLGYSTGPSDLLIEAFFYSHEHLLDFMRRKVASIQGVTRTETTIILKIAKFSFEWELPLEAPEVG